jgi:ADP-ribosylglycohydrolase
MLRVLPVAAVALMEQDFWNPRLEPRAIESRVEDWARNLAGLTHDDGTKQAVSALAVRVAWECLREEGQLRDAVERALNESPERAADQIWSAFHAARSAPRDQENLANLAPDRSAVSALAGGIYATLSFPGEDETAQALEFARQAPDGDSAAAVAGAFLGSRHGYEAFPTTWVGRLELGWAIDRLARDLAAQVREHQGGNPWKSDSHSEHVAIDPWWDRKYPGM